MKSLPSNDGRDDNQVADRRPSYRVPGGKEDAGRPSAESTPSGHSDPSGAARPSILLVDDEPGILGSVGRFLKACGYEVETAASGEDAARKLRQRQFDAIISDLRMPGLSGEQLFELIEAEFPRMTSRTVFTSGDMAREQTAAFIARSGCPALHKPYEMPALLAVLKQVTGNGEAGTDRD